MPSPKGSAVSRALDLSPIQVGKKFALDRLPTKADVISLARYFQSEKQLDPRNYPLKTVAKDVTTEVLLIYDFICSYFKPPVLIPKDKIQEQVLRLLKRAQIATPNLKAKDNKIEAFLGESVEFFDIFACKCNR